MIRFLYFGSKIDDTFNKKGHLPLLKICFLHNMDFLEDLYTFSFMDFLEDLFLFH